MSHYVVSVKPSPVTPSPAATLVLLRDRPGGGVEVLLMQRHRNRKFAAGDFVFPGGKIEVDDNPEDAAAWCRGLDVGDAARRLRLDDAPLTALGYWIGVIRETFEEAGLLLAVDAAGRDVAVDAARFAEYRRACHADNRAFWTMLRTEGLRRRLGSRIGWNICDQALSSLTNAALSILVARAVSENAFGM